MDRKAELTKIQLKEKTQEILLDQLINLKTYEKEEEEEEEREKLYVRLVSIVHETFECNSQSFSKYNSHNTREYNLQNLWV